MAFLRMGTVCAVTNSQGEILLSRRGDLDIWNLPGGRLDSGETLEDAALREVHEETGVISQNEGAVGLYYWQGWQRMNVLYRAIATGGTLNQRTDETLVNRYFALKDIPDDISALHAHDALNGSAPVCRVITTPPAELRRVRWALRRRYVQNLLRGRPEPRFVRWRVIAVAVVWDEWQKRVVTVPEGKLFSHLPQIICDGRKAPWEALAQACKKYTTTTPTLEWVGFVQTTATNTLRFIFRTQVPQDAITPAGRWETVQNIPLDGLDCECVLRSAQTLDTAWAIRTE